MISTAVRPFGLSLALRTTRRWLVVGYWLLVALLFVLMELDESKALRRGHGLQPLFPLQVLVFVPALLGGVKVGGPVKPFRGAHWVPQLERQEIQTLFSKKEPILQDADLDERETLQRDRVHFFAYTAARWMAIGLLAIFCLVAAWNPAWSVRFGSASFYLLVLTLWSLPQSILLWTEPDMEVEE